MSSESYVYELIDPLTNMPRYVGQTQDPLSRYRAHCNIMQHEKCLAKYDKTTVTYQRALWFLHLDSLGLTPHMSVIYKCQSKEKALYKEYEIYKERMQQTQLFNGSILKKDDPGGYAIQHEQYFLKVFGLVPEEYEHHHEVNNLSVQNLIMKNDELEKTPNDKQIDFIFEGTAEQLRYYKNLSPSFVGDAAYHLYMGLDLPFNLPYELKRQIASKGIDTKDAITQALELWLKHD